MPRRKIDAVKITGNIALTVTASLLYLWYHHPTTCDHFANVLVAVGANFFGLIQNPPTTRPTPEDYLRGLDGK